MRPPGPLEIGLVLLIILIVFGAGKLPQVFSALGQGFGSLGRDSSEENDDKASVRKTRKKSGTKTAQAARKAGAQETSQAGERPVKRVKKGIFSSEWTSIILVIVMIVIIGVALIVITFSQ